MRHHSKLKVFHLADRLAMLVYAHTRTFPSEERFGLCSQLRRAAVSVAANIVEGAARTTGPDFARMLTIAYASTRELEYEISLTVRLGYFLPDAARELEDIVSQTGRALRALIRSVSSSG